MKELAHLEEKKTAKGRFLSSGPGLCMIGSGTIQTTIRVWSESELRANEILCESLAKVFSNIIPEGGKSTEKSGRVGSCVMTTPPPHQNNKKTNIKTKSTMKTNNLRPSMSLKFGTPSISKFFRSTESINLDKEMKRLEKERRLEIVRKESFIWKERR